MAHSVYSLLKALFTAFCKRVVIYHFSYKKRFCGYCMACKVYLRFIVPLQAQKSFSRINYNSEHDSKPETGNRKSNIHSRITLDIFWHGITCYLFPMRTIWHSMPRIANSSPCGRSLSPTLPKPQNFFATFFGRILVFYAFCAPWRKIFDFKKWFYCYTASIIMHCRAKAYMPYRLYGRGYDSKMCEFCNIRTE